MSKSEKTNLTVEKLFSYVMEVPGIKVNRIQFLKNNFGNRQELLNCRPIDIFPPEILDKRAKQVRKLHTSTATMASLVAGIPGGWAMLPAGFADIIQYYANSLILMQKLGYIYGWPDLQDANGNFSEETINIMLLYLGVSNGVGAANKFIQEAGEAVGKRAAKYIVNNPVTKDLWYQVLKKLLDFFGKKLTKEGAAQIAKKAVPILGAVISGGLTLTTFSIENKRLQKNLKKEQEFSDSLNHHFIISTGILK